MMSLGNVAAHLVILLAPSNIVLPVISGNAWEGSTLSTTDGTWAGSPTPTYTYQWKRAGTNISGATASTYQLTSSDTGNAITVAVTATNTTSPFTATATSSATATVIVPPLVNSTGTGSALLVSEGDSITAGTMTGAVSWSSLFAGTDTPNITFSNQAVSASYLSDVVSRAATDDALITSNPGKVNYILAVFVGEKDVENPTYYPSNPAGFLTAYASYLDARRAAGWKVAAATFLPRSGAPADANYETWRGTINTGIRGFVAAGHANAVIDFAADTVMGPAIAATNTTLISDGTHPTLTGERYMERVAAPVLSGLMTPGASTAGQPIGLTLILTKAS